MQTARDNKALVESIFVALAEGNGQPFAGAMADDFDWTISGQGPWARTWRGKDAVRRSLFAPLFAQFADTYRNRALRVVRGRQHGRRRMPRQRGDEARRTLRQSLHLLDRAARGPHGVVDRIHGHGARRACAGGTGARVNPTLRIGELAARSGRSVHAIRWYDAQGLIPGVAREGGGRRIFTERHVEWLALVDRLRSTGMSVAEIRRYAALVRQGRVGVPGQHALLAAHRAHVVGAFAEWQAALRAARREARVLRGMAGHRQAARRRNARVGDGTQRAQAAQMKAIDAVRTGTGSQRRSASRGLAGASVPLHLREQVVQLLGSGRQ